jgi:hypothetical protein
MVESLDPGETLEGSVVDPDPYGREGTIPGATTLEGIVPSTAPSETTPGPQQAPWPLLRLKTRLETRPKKPHGLNRPVPSPQ